MSIWERYNFLFDSEVILQQGQKQIDEGSERGVLLVLSSIAFSPSPISIQFEAGALSASCQSRWNIVLPPKSDLSKIKKLLNVWYTMRAFVRAISWYFLFLFSEAKLYPSHPWRRKVNSVWNSLSSLTFPWSFIFGSLCLWEGWWICSITYQCYFIQSQVPRVKFDENPHLTIAAHVFLCLFFLNHQTSHDMSP